MGRGRGGRASWSGALLLPIFVPCVSSAQPVAIEHQAVACMVVEQYPVLDACFEPGSRLARARVYFRPEGFASWYYVEASRPAPPKVNDPPGRLCRRATLPRPTARLLQKHVEYYVDALGKRLESSQTEIHRPLVVKSRSECKDGLLASSLPAAAVQVLPALPAGFAVAGLSGATLAVVGAGVAAVTGTVVAVTGGGGGATVTTTTSTSSTSTLPSPTTTTTTTTTTLPAPCGTPAVMLTSPPPLSTYNEVTPGLFPVPFRAGASDPNGIAQVKYLLDVITALPTGPTGLRPIPGATSSRPPDYPFDWPLASVQRFLKGTCTTTAVVVARATNRCGNSATARNTGIITILLPVSCLSPGASLRQRPHEVPSALPAQNAPGWVSQLEVPGGRGQVVLNGSQALFPSAGRVSLPLEVQAGENRLEATLVQAEGRHGLWRFEPGPSVEPGSLRVIASEAALVTAEGVAFRLKGRPGERVVFTFRTRP